MRFSVLLPTRNGGVFIENCIRSVLEQDHRDFELVVSDNANTDQTPEILQGFSTDRRVRVLRQEQPLPVTENWTATIANCTSDYVLMIGDDDYLLPQALSTLDRVLKRHDNPDCVLFNGYSYVAPNAIEGDQTSYWAVRHFAYEAALAGESIIGPAQRHSIVRDIFRFRQRTALNMQTALFSKRAAMAVPGGPFQPPFPDFHLINALLISAEKVAYVPDRLVIIGVSPKSFGHYFYSQNAQEGLAYLGIDTHFPAALPGNELLNGMCLALTRLKQNYPRELAAVDIDRSGYLIRQVYFWLLQFRYHLVGLKELRRRFAILSLWDWISLLRGTFRISNVQRLYRGLRAARGSLMQALWHNLVPLDGPRNIRELAQWLERHGEMTG